MTEDKYTPDLNKAEDSLIAAIDAEAATRLPFGHDALWVPSAPVALAAAARESGAPREAAPRSHLYGVVVDSVKVSVLLYVPVRSASLDLTGCLNETLTRSLETGAAVRLQRSPAAPRRCPTSNRRPAPARAARTCR